MRPPAIALDWSQTFAAPTYSFSTRDGTAPASSPDAQSTSVAVCCQCTKHIITIRIELLVSNKKHNAVVVALAHYLNFGQKDERVIYL